MLNVHRSGMLLWVDELVGWMRKLDRDDQAGVRQQFLTLCNGIGRLNIDRMGHGETVVDSPCAGVFGCCTPGGMSDYIQSALRGGRGDDGLVQRLQIMVWADAPKVWKHVDRLPNAEAQSRLAEVFRFVGSLDPQLFGLRDEGDENGIPWLRFGDEGQDVFDAWEASLQIRLRSEELAVSLECA